MLLSISFCDQWSRPRQLFRILYGHLGEVLDLARKGIETVPLHERLGREPNLPVTKNISDNVLDDIGMTRNIEYTNKWN